MFYGFYSSTEDQGKHFLTEPQDKMEFPPHVLYNNISYRYIRCYVIATPKAKKNLMEWVETVPAETNVKIPRKK